MQFVHSKTNLYQNCRLIASNPVTACLVFQHRFQSFLTSVILSPANPIGKVTDHFFRVEFQARGWPHIHALFGAQTLPNLIGIQTMKNFVNMWILTCLAHYQILHAIQFLVNWCQLCSFIV